MAPTAPVRVAELVGQAVADLGAAHAFGVVGSGNFAVTNALVAAGVPFVAARHEGGAATMADAYARTSGRVTVLSVHQGCGLTNAMTGIAEAAKSRTPLLVLAADVAGSAVGSNFRIDQDTLVRSVGAVPERVHSPGSALQDVSRAYRTAYHGRRAVVLNLPLDVQAAEVAESRRLAPLSAAPRTAPDPDVADALAQRLRDAERPVFLAGRGAMPYGREIAALAERVGALLTTSAVAAGTFADEAYDLGICGGFATPLAAELVAGADLVVAWGCSLTSWTTRHGRLLGAEALLAQVDDDPAALGARRPVDLGVLGDVGLTVSAVADRMAGNDNRPGYRTPDVARRLRGEGRWPQLAFTDLSSETTIDPRALSGRLDDVLPRNRQLAVDSGNFMGYPASYLSVPAAGAFCFTQSFQSIGLGLATAIGAALAAPDRLPVLGTGDGGFLMGIAELETAVRLRLGLLVVVYDDAAYGAEVHHFGPDGADLSTVRFPDADLAALARGFGAEGLTVRDQADLDPVAVWLAGPRDRPLVVDAKISSDGGSWWLHEAFRAH
ncbi:MAG TPA: thiamine pyrophosphate-binding protein [Microlunatus sp.]|nr:thiamine pyrophosphate-binding protein [Microlunatus sp.]